jgi:hypothetical protein
MVEHFCHMSLARSGPFPLCILPVYVPFHTHREKEEEEEEEEEGKR